MHRPQTRLMSAAMWPALKISIPWTRCGVTRTVPTVSTRTPRMPPPSPSATPMVMTLQQIGQIVILAHYKYCRFNRSSRTKRSRLASSATFTRQFRRTQILLTTRLGTWNLSKSSIITTPWDTSTGVTRNVDPPQHVLGTMTWVKLQLGHRLTVSLQPRSHLPPSR